MAGDPTVLPDCSVSSEFVDFKGRNGLKIAACIDQAASEAEHNPWVVMAPKYGETKKSNLHLAYFLAANGFNVLRFDLTHHIGESEGDMTQFTLSGMVDDIRSAFDFLEATRDCRAGVLFSASLSARGALRAAMLDHRIDRLVCLVGVVNLQHTLREVYREDIVGTFLAGRKWGVTDILGFNIDGETFVGTSIKSDMHDLGGTLKDISQIDIPVVYFYAEKDLWVDWAEVQQVFGGRHNCRLIPVRGAMHEVRENPKAADAAYHGIVSACRDSKSEGDEQHRIPDKKDVFRQNKVERERLREALPEKTTEVEFWSSYLKRYELLEKADDYREYLDLVGRLLGSLGSNTRVLDAGCGNGMFGAWLWLRAQRGREAQRRPCLYVGLELTEGGLQDSISRHTGLMHDQPGAGAGNPALREIEYAYMRADFDSIDGTGATGLPFLDGTFDKVCCSLVISYLQHPEQLLAELARITKPGGVLVISSMKPFCDLSEIYRDFIQQNVEVEDIEAARGLLRAAGMIKLKEEKGSYQFFFPQELATMAIHAGFRDPETHVSLGNQANVLRAMR